MKTHKYQPEILSIGETIRRREVQQEIDNYLLALSSYPERFANDPCVSFEQHLFSMMAAGHRAARLHLLERPVPKVNKAAGSPSGLDLETLQAARWPRLERAMPPTCMRGSLPKV